MNDFHVFLILLAISAVAFVPGLVILINQSKSDIIDRRMSKINGGMFLVGSGTFVLLVSICVYIGMKRE